MSQTRSPLDPLFFRDIFYRIEGVEAENVIFRPGGYDWDSWKGDVTGMRAKY